MYGFVIVYAIALLVLFIATIFVTWGYIEGDSAKVQAANTSFSGSASTGSTYLLIATFIGWIFILLELADVIISLVTSTFNTPPLSTFFEKPTLDQNELLDFVNDAERAADIKRNIIIVIVATIVGILAVLAMGGLALGGSIEMGKVKVGTAASIAQSKSLIGTILTFTAGALMIVAVIFLFIQYGKLSRLMEASGEYAEKHINIQQVDAIKAETKEEAAQTASLIRHQQEALQGANKLAASIAKP